MKKILFFLLSMLCTMNVYASVPLPNGKGYILPQYPTGPMNTGNSLPAIVKLDSLNPNALYDVVCHVSTDEVDAAAAVFVRFDILGLETAGEYNGLTIDGKINYSHQYQLKDKADHVVTFHQVKTGTGISPSQVAYISMTRLDGWMIPFDYDCQVDFVVGKNK